MRKLILTAALVLMSVSAQAGQTRGLIMASNEAPKPSVAEQLKALGPEPSTVQTVEVRPEAKAESKSDAKTVTPAKPEPKAEPNADAKPVAKPVTKKRETDEQKARRIAARYGISW